MEKKVLLHTVDYLAKKQNPDEEDLKNEKRAWKQLIELGVKNPEEMPARLSEVDLASDEEKAAEEAARIAQEKADQEAKEKAEREAAEQAEKERLEKEAAEQAEKERLEKEAAEKAKSEGGQGNGQPEGNHTPTPETPAPAKTTAKKTATKKAASPQ